MESTLKVLRRILPPTLLRTLQPIYHFVLAGLAAFWCGLPSRRLTVIGVTGTDGKTTTVHLLHEMLTAAGHRVGSLSSLRFKINDLEEPNLLKMTMPGRFRLQQFLARCRASGCRFVVIEVTSQGIKQFRHRFIGFQAAVLTNVTPEHIEDHGGFEAYRASKLELFRRLPAKGIAVLNRQDASAERFAAVTPATRIAWYERSAVELGGVGRPVRVLRVEPQRIQLEIENVFIESALGGAFNVMNILAAAAAAMAFDVSLTAIAQAVGRVRGIPGRLEYVQRQPFAVVVDYANTPVAYERVYQALQEARSKKQEARLICVFGAPGGGRDRWKRPEIGKIAGRYCQQIVLTSDDPDDEDPAQIAEEIRSGIIGVEMSPTGVDSKKYSPSRVEEIPLVKIVLDRREAIRQALRDVKSGDTIIITGMGAQPWQVIMGKKIPWDDRKVVREELQKLKKYEDEE